jgi:hypothetical protein
VGTGWRTCATHYRCLVGSHSGPSLRDQAVETYWEEHRRVNGNFEDPAFKRALRHLHHSCAAYGHNFQYRETWRTEHNFVNIFKCCTCGTVSPYRTDAGWSERVGRLSTRPDRPDPNAPYSNQWHVEVDGHVDPPAENA